MLSALATALEPHGLNLIGATVVEAYDASVPAGRRLRELLPGARSAIVIGNGGGSLWVGYREFCRRHPEHARVADPLDAFTRRVVEEAAAPLIVGQAARFLYPFRFPDDPVSFMRLAACAGLGRPGLVGVLLHPVYGPWMALRAAILVPTVVTAPRPADDFDPCPSCVERACVAACPVSAVTGAGWNVNRCAAHRARDDEGCGSRCHARFECVLGRAHRHPAEALAYHQAAARPALMALVRGS